MDQHARAHSSDGKAATKEEVRPLLKVQSCNGFALTESAVFRPFLVENKVV